MFCGNCGGKIDDGAKFCGKCGTKVAENTDNTPVSMGTEQGGSQTIPQSEQGDEVVAGSIETDNDIDLLTFMPKTSEDFVKRGNAQTDNELAISDFTEAIRLNPNNSDAFFKRGIAYHEKEQYDLAIVDFTESIRINPNEPSFFRRGLSYQWKNQYDLAITDYSKAIQLAPDFSTAIKNRAEAYLSSGQYDLAIADFTEEIRLYQGGDLAAVIMPGLVPRAHNFRGLAYNSKGQYDLAIADYNIAIQLDPNDCVYFNNRAVAYCEKKQYDLAIADITEAIRLDPNNGDYFHNRSVAYCEKKQYDLAIADLTQAIRLDPNNSDHFSSRASAYLKKKQYDLAIVDITEMLRINPNDYETRKTLETVKSLKRACFITTAVCGSFSKPDDCYELTQFRNFRDNWLLAQPDGKQIVDRYYQIAPDIVVAIDKTAESKAVYTGIWNDYLAECLCLIEAGKLEDCKTKYTDMVETLERKYLM